MLIKNSRQNCRILLDSFNIKDSKQWFKMVSTYEVSRYLTGLYVQSIEDAYENIIEYQRQNGKGDFYIAIRLLGVKETLIGGIIATRPRDDNESKTLEIAYIIREGFRQNGYMTEALTRFINTVKDAGYGKLIFEIAEENLVSQRVVRKLGAKYIGYTKLPECSMTLKKYLIQNQI